MTGNQDLRPNWRVVIKLGIEIKKEKKICQAHDHSRANALRSVPCLLMECAATSSDQLDSFLWCQVLLKRTIFIVQCMSTKSQRRRSIIIVLVMPSFSYFLLEF